MRYRVVYKKFLESSKGFSLVEDIIDAANCRVIDGNLVFYGEIDNESVLVMAIPIGSWASCEAITHDEPVSSNLIVGG